VSSRSLRRCAESHAEAAVPTYDIEVTRDGGWWMIHIPALDGH
jgi:hypothetical protein